MWFSWSQLIMWGIGGVLIWLAIARRMEPALLLPMGFGAILVNLPDSGAGAVLEHLFQLGIAGHELMPLMLFIGIGAMIDFEPLLANPKLMLFGAAAQFGILFTLCASVLLGFDLKDAASVAIIGAADGPTAIFVSQALESGYTAAIMVAAYSYMALVPLVQPPVIRLCTTEVERKLKMPPARISVPRLTKLLFPILTTVVVGLAAPKAAALVGFLMFGNLVRVCGVLDSLSDTAQKVLANLVTIFLGLAIAARMTAAEFLRPETLLILVLGLVAFVMDTVGGVLAAKFMNLFLKEKINPMLGAAGISAFPMAARTVNRIGLEADCTNHLLMHAVGVNVAGQIASVAAGGMILSLLA